MKRLNPSPVGGSLWIPSSKSQTIRGLLIALAAHDRSVLENPLYSADTESCMTLLEKVGCTLVRKEHSILVDSSRVDGRGKSVDIDTGNSGTTTYLAYGILGTLGYDSIRLHGDSQLNRRPIAPLAEAYADLGLEGRCTDGCPPVTITGHLKGGKTSIECPTSQWLSSLLLSLPLAEGDSIVDVPLLYEKPYVGMTLDWLDWQGISYTITDDMQHVEIPGGQSCHPFTRPIAGDWSSASFFLAAAAITGSRLTLHGLDKDDSQGDKAVVDILCDMGCTAVWNDGALTIEGPEKLRGGQWDINATPDALPILSVLACGADGPVRLYNVASARIKETDRISAMAGILTQLGLKVDEGSDYIEIQPGRLKEDLVLPGHGDHRIIMAEAILSLVCPLTIDDERAAAVTFPTFFTLLESIRKEA